MWRYQHPDFALFLLCELQKQQQGSIFCDTLLQTEGVCVPAHSCVLAALSPVFSRILSSSPAPQAGQSRLLNLEAVGSHALLKLVGFLYTGEMEIESRREHEEVMTAALRLGLRNIFGKKRVLVESGVERRWREAAVQTEDSVRSREREVVPERLKIQSSTATLVQPSDLLEPPLPPSSLFDAIPTRGFNLINNIAVPELREASVSNHHKTKAKKRWKMAKRESQLKKFTRQQNQITVLNVEGTVSNQIGMAERSRNVSGKDLRRLLDTDNRQNSAVTEQKEAKLDQLKVKIKLRRRTGACWESNLLVSVQGENERNPEEAKESGSLTQSCPSNVLPGQNLGTLTPPTDLPISPSNSSTHASSDKCLHTPHHISVSSPLEVPAFSVSPPQADESDEHIAMLLEDMFMMGLNILPLMPLDRNLDEQDQLGSLQEQKGGQRCAEGSTQSTCLFVQNFDPEMRESDVCKTEAPDGSSGPRDEDHLSFQNQTRCCTAKLLESPGKDNLTKVNILRTVGRNSTPPPEEDALLTPKTMAVPDKPSPATDVMASSPDYRSDFKLLQCLSPLETEKADSDVPTQEFSKPSHSRDPEPQKLPLWLSESPLILDFPLSSMIDSSCPRLQHDLSVCQNRSSPDLAGKEELKTSFSHNDLISGSKTNIIGLDVRDASEQPKQRKTRRRRLATQSSKRKKVKNEGEVQPKISKCDDMPTSNVHRVSTRLSSANRNVAAAVKRKRDISSPCRKKMAQLSAVRKQHEYINILTKPNVPGVVKHRRGRPPKSKETQACLCKNAQKIPISGQNYCEVEKTKTDSEIEGGKKQEANTQQEKDSTEMEEADVYNNSSQTKLNSHLKYGVQVKGPSILDQIFHQTLPSLACKSSLIIDQQQTSSLRDTSFCIQSFREESKDENNKLLMNGSEQINKSMCTERKAETSTLMNHMVHEEVYYNHTASPLSCGDLLENGKCSVKDGDVNIENSSSRISSVFQNEMGKDVQDQMTEVSDPLASDEDIIKDIIMSVDDADHVALPSKTDGVGTTNQDLKHLRENSKATVSDEPSFEVTNSKKNTQTEHAGSCEDICWAADCLENDDKAEDLGTNKEVEMIKETMEGDETEVQRAYEFVKEKALLASDDVCWETTSGWDDGDTDLEGDQYCAEMIDGPIQEGLSEGHSASAKIADDSTNAVLTLRETEEIISGDVCSEDVATLLSNGSRSESKEDCQLDDEDIEVDVLGEFQDSPLGLLAARKVMTLMIEGPLDQEDELDATEEEEVDVTGEESG